MIYKYQRARFNREDAEYINNAGFKFEQKKRYTYCFMGDFTSRLIDAPLTDDVKDALIWANIKCYLKDKYGKDYYKKYVITDLQAL